MSSLYKIEESFERYRKSFQKYPERIYANSTRKIGRAKKAAVALLFDQAGESVLLTQRAFNLKNHPAEAAFPGGMMDDCDSSLIDTLCRELQEEVGVTSQQISIIEGSDQFISKNGHLVSAYCAQLNQESHQIGLKLCSQEVHKAEWLSLKSLCQLDNWTYREELEYFLNNDVGDEEAAFMLSKDFHYKKWNPKIWGLTAFIFIIFLKRSGIRS